MTSAMMSGDRWLDEANRMQESGIDVLKLNIGNPAPFGFSAPEEVILDMIYNLRESQGYSDSKGIFSARKAIMQYCQLKNIPDVTINDIYTGNGVSELISILTLALLNDGDEILVPSPGLSSLGQGACLWQEENRSTISVMRSRTGIRIWRI